MNFDSDAVWNAVFGLLAISLLLWGSSELVPAIIDGLMGK